MPCQIRVLQMVEFDAAPRRKPSMNLTALMDIAFILVIFIVLAANFHRIKTLEVELPSAKAKSVPKPKAMAVTIHADGVVDIQGEKFTLSNVHQALKEKKDQFESVLLVSDKSTPVEKAILVLGHAQDLGYKSVGIATEPGK